MANIGLFLLLVGISVFVLVYGMRIRAQRNERLAGLYEKAIDAGIDPRMIKFELDEREQGDPYGNLKAGIILLAVALAIVIGVWAAYAAQGSMRLIGFALVPGAIGLAVLFLHFAIPRDKPRPASSGEGDGEEQRG
jgi:multisubunit Na+/H+ antiporter MnhC subunit